VDGRSIICTVPDGGSFVVAGSLTAMLPTYAFPTGRITRRIWDARRVGDGQASINYRASAFAYD